MQNPSEENNSVPKRLRRWMEEAKQRGWNAWRKQAGKDSTGKAGTGEIWYRKSWEAISNHPTWLKVGLFVLALFFAADLVARVFAIWIRPVPVARPARVQFSQNVVTPPEDYDAIVRRNMFAADGKIPDPFDQGLLDCMSQARPSTQRLQLLGTIVMGNEDLSVALVQEESNPLKVAVRKDELFFDGKYQAMKVERKKLCFQVKATQEFEFIEVPEDGSGLLNASGMLAQGGGSDGITPVSETEYQVKKAFLDEKLMNLNDILQTARAVPYIDGGKFKGFLIQSMEPSSPFAQLGLRQSDVLTAVNGIPLDNAGKGIEAFNMLRNSRRIELEVLRGGQKSTFNYDVK